jgi:hypothetical protein
MGYHIISDKLSVIYQLCENLERFIKTEYQEDGNLVDMAHSLKLHAGDNMRAIGCIEPDRNKP